MRILFLILILFHWSNSYSQIFRWTGEVNNDWNNPQNWNTQQVPDSTSHVEIRSLGVGIWPPAFWPNFTSNVHVRKFILDGAELNFNGFDLKIGLGMLNFSEIFSIRNGIIFSSGGPTDTTIIDFPTYRIPDGYYPNTGTIRFSNLSGNYKLQKNDTIQFSITDCNFSGDVTLVEQPKSFSGTIFGRNQYGGNVVIIHQSPTPILFEQGPVSSVQPVIQGDLFYSYTGPQNLTSSILFGSPANVSVNPILIKGKIFIDGIYGAIRLNGITNETPGGKIVLKSYRSIQIGRNNLLVDSVDLIAEVLNTEGNFMNIDSNNISGVFRFLSEFLLNGHPYHRTISKNVFHSEVHVNSIFNRMNEAPVPNSGNIYLDNAYFSNNISLGLRDTSQFHKNLTIIPSDSTKVYHLQFAGSDNGKLNSSGDTVKAISVTMSKTGGGRLDLLKPLIVDSLLELSGGVIESSSNNPVLLNPSGVLSGGNENSHVDGPFIRTGQSEFTFPVGDGSSYHPLTYSATPAITTYSVDYNPSSPAVVTDTSVHAGSLHHLSDCEYWKVSGTTPVNITAAYGPHCTDGGNYISNPSNLRLASWNGNSWIDIGNSSVSGSNLAGTVSSSIPVVPNGYITLGSVDPQNSFEFSWRVILTGQKNSSRADLQWENARESNLSDYRLERSEDNIAYNQIHSTNATNQSGVQQYNYTDAQPLNGLNFFRLKIMETDGHFRYSNVVQLEFINDTTTNPTEPPNMVVYPNPASNSINVMVDSDYNKAMIIDAIGRTISIHTMMRGLNNINVENLPAGVYFLKLLTATRQKVLKWMKM